MYLSRHETSEGPRWALDGHFLPRSFDLNLFLELPSNTNVELLKSLPTGRPAPSRTLPPLEPMHEVWASGVTYVRSRQARQAESSVSDVYSRVYDAVRPEIFFKAIGWRVVGDTGSIRIRPDSQWNVPEPEMVLVVNCHREIVGICAGNDMSSRDIEGENPLYLPQAKIYNGSCALGPGILVADPDAFKDLPVQMEILRQVKQIFQGQTRTSKMKRRIEDLVTYLCKELDFPHGVFLMTGTGIVPPDDFTLQPGDVIKIAIGSLTLENQVRP